MYYISAGPILGLLKFSVFHSSSCYKLDMMKYESEDIYEYGCISNCGLLQLWERVKATEYCIRVVY